MVTRVEKLTIWIQFEIARPVAAIKSLRFALFLRWLNESFERMDNWMEGQEEEQNDAITLPALSPAGRGCICQSEISISVVDLLNDVAHTPYLLL